MSGPVQHVVVVGGGTAGWLSACTVAAHRPGIRVTLVEAPGIPTIGVGEGTWPTMRQTLASIGIAEDEFLRECDAAFKQGSRFDRWVTGAAGDSYLHPFSPPPAIEPGELVAAWREGAADVGFAAAMTPQAAVCARNLAPRQRGMPGFAGALNYAYHLDAGKFAALLARHGVGRLGVTHLAGEVTHVEADQTGRIAALTLRGGGRIEGDLFLDCSGAAAVLIGGHCAVEWVDRSDVSFNDRALAVQVAVEPDSPIASQTVGTAHAAGWLWDIALPTRRGIGCVYASRFMSDDAANAVLLDYLRERLPAAEGEKLAIRQLRFAAGHRARFWQGNCLAIGQAAGFIEPLEASAIVLIELSLRALVENFPASHTTMELHAQRFNRLFRYRWERIVEFLKLHYVLSRREEPYWRAQRDPATIPPRLAEQLALWREQPPSAWDFPEVDEIFPAASHQYVLYGMGYPAPRTNTVPSPAALAALAAVQERSRALTAGLPDNRTYLSAMAQAA
jgi:hypothetical protein